MKLKQNQLQNDEETEEMNIVWCTRFYLNEIKSIVNSLIKTD